MSVPPVPTGKATPLPPHHGPSAVRHVPVVESAGAVVWRTHGKKLQVRLVHRPKYRDWSWPKGKLDPGESFPAAAVREVAEETGSPVILGTPLPGLQYLLGDGSVKRVHYWAAQKAAAQDQPALDARAPVAPVSRGEIDDMVWLSAEAAAERLTRPADQTPLRALVHADRRQRLRTHAVIIVRHGRAIPRASWHGDEANRPLTPAGHAQAVALIPTLAAFGAVAGITSPWDRCHHTAAAYFRAAGITPTAAAHLTEAEHERSSEQVIDTVRELLWGTTTTVLCTHRPVLPTIFRTLATYTRKRALKALPGKDPYLSPGEALIAHVTHTAKGPRVIAIERLAPSWQ